MKRISLKWFGVFALLLIAVVIGAGSFKAKSRQQRPNQKIDDRPRVTSMPPVLSKIKNLEVVKAWIEYVGTPAAGVVVEIRNNSNKNVMAVDLVSGEGSVTKSGLDDEENPIVVIKPGDTTTVYMNFGEMTFGAPLVVAGVIYADGAEEGEKASLSAMRLMRSHDRAQRKAEKERKAQEEPTP